MSKFMGHSSIQMTANNYDHRLGDEKRRTIARLPWLEESGQLVGLNIGHPRRGAFFVQDARVAVLMGDLTWDSLQPARMSSKIPSLFCWVDQEISSPIIQKEGDRSNTACPLEI